MISLEPRKYKVNQDYNEYFYFINYLYVTETPSWFVQTGTNDSFDFHKVAFPIYPEGFATAEAALNELEEYLKVFFPKKNIDVNDLGNFQERLNEFDEWLKEANYGK